MHEPTPRDMAELSIRNLRQAGIADAAVAAGIGRALRAEPVAPLGPDAEPELRRLAWLLHVWMPEVDPSWTVIGTLALSLAEQAEWELDKLLEDIAMASDLATPHDRLLVKRVWTMPSEAVADALEDARAKLRRNPERIKQGVKGAVDVLKTGLREAAGLPGSGPDGALSRAFYDGLKPEVKTALTMCLIKGGSAFASNQGQAAYDAYTECLGLAPDYFAAHALRARVLTGTGHAEQAVGDVERALTLAPQSYLAALAEAELRLAQGLSSAAIASVTRALEINRTAEALALRGFWRLQLGEAAAAEADYTEAIEKEPGSKDHHYNRGTVRHALGDLKGARADFGEALRLDPDDLQALLNRGTIAAALEDGEAALADFCEAVRVAPLNSKGYLKRAVLAMNFLERPDLAFADAFTVDAIYSRLAPEAEDARTVAADLMALASAGISDQEALAEGALSQLFTNTLETLLEAQEIDGALALLDGINEAFPAAGPRVCTKRGVVYELAGDTQLAWNAFQAAVQLDARQLDAWQSLADLGALAPPQELLGIMNEGLRHFPEDAHLHFKRAVALRELGDLEGALAATATAARLAPESVEAHQIHATLLCTLGRRAEAIVETQALIERWPERASLHYGLGISLQKVGRLAEAQASTRRAIALAPENAESHYRLACTLALAGEPEAALSSIAAALRLKPSLRRAMSADSDFVSLQPLREFQGLVAGAEP